MRYLIDQNSAHGCRRSLSKGVKFNDENDKKTTKTNDGVITTQQTSNRCQHEPDGASNNEVSQCYYQYLYIEIQRERKGLYYERDRNGISNELLCTRLASRYRGIPRNTHKRLSSEKTVNRHGNRHKCKKSKNENTHFRARKTQSMKERASERKQVRSYSVGMSG